VESARENRKDCRRCDDYSGQGAPGEAGRGREAGGMVPAALPFAACSCNMRRRTENKDWPDKK